MAQRPGTDANDRSIPADLLQQVRRLEIRTRRTVDELFGGEYHSVFKGRGMEFREVREYIPGDDTRSIDWNTTARMGAPFIKKYEEERELTVMLVADLSASGLFGTSHRRKIEAMAELGALLAFSAVSNQDKVGLILFTDEVELFVPPKKGRSHALRLVRELLFHPARSKGNRPRRGPDHAQPRAETQGGRVPDQRLPVRGLRDPPDHRRAAPRSGGHAAGGSARARVAVRRPGAVWRTRRPVNWRSSTRPTPGSKARTPRAAASGSVNSRRFCAA